MKQFNLLQKGLLVSITILMVIMVNVENGFSASVENPMTTDLDGGGYDIYNVAGLEVADIIANGPWVDVRAYASFSAAITDIGFGSEKRDNKRT